MNASLRWFVPGAGVLALLAVPAAARAETIIEGGSVGGQIWTAQNGPYRVLGRTGHAEVPAGEELRIEPGTVVRFSDAAIQVRLNVAGTLRIAGTVAEPVILQKDAGPDALWAGIWTVGDAAVLEISNAIIRNAVNGLQLDLGARAHVEKTTVEDSTNGIYVENGAFAFDSIIVRRNKWGIIVAGSATPGDSPSLLLTNVLVQQNAVNGLEVWSGSLTVVNATLYNNGAGIAAMCLGPLAAIDVQNTVFSYNTRAIDLDEGPIGASGVSAIVKQSTFWNNGVNSRLTSLSGTTTTAATDPPAGAGNAVVDPEFLAANDPHLTAGSPCIDSGSADRAPANDLDGNQRPYGGGVDRGAYEFVGPGGGVGGAAGGGGGAGSSGGGGGGVTGGYGGTGGVIGGSAGTNGSGGLGGAAGGATGGGSGRGAAGSGGTGRGGSNIMTAPESGCGCATGGSNRRWLAVLCAALALRSCRRRSR